jgi:secreted trypsin-like serine protease
MPGTTYIRYKYPFESFCTASLIAPKRVLTAAHCIEDLENPRNWTAFVGARDVGDHNTPRDGEPIGVTGIAVHQGFSYPFYDVAVMFLKRPSGIPPTPIANEDEWSTTGWALGYGHYNFDHHNRLLKGPLQTAQLSTGTNAQCQSWTTSYQPSLNLCTAAQGERCTTHGDSGGPFVALVNGVYKQIGVLSGGGYDVSGFGSPCETNSPGGWLDLWGWVAGPVLRPYVLGVGNPACRHARKKFKRVKRVWWKGSKQFRSAKRFKQQACRGI